MPISVTKNEDRFWRWFEEKSSELRPRNISRDWQLQRILDKKVKNLNVPGWEIGPFSQDPDLSFFALSPMYDKEEFSLTQRLVKRAPEIPGWVFLAAKPVKKWDRSFEWRGDLVDASDWKLVVHSFEDGMNDFVFIDDALGAISEDQLMSVMVFLIGSELGELEFMQRANAIEYDAHPTSEAKKSAIALRELRDVLGT